MLRFARVLPVLIAAFAGLIASGQPPAPPAKLTAEQQEKLETRDRFINDANKFERAGKLAEARAAVEKGLAIEREVFGDSHVEVAESISWLTDLCLRAEDFPSARAYGKKALAARKQLDGESHWRTTDARLDLEDVERRAGLTEKQRADLDTAARLMQDVHRLYARREYPKAREAAEAVLSVRVAILGKQNRDYAGGLTYLGRLYKSQGLFAKAESLYEEATAVRRKILGEKHPDYARSLHNLALLYQDRGSVAKAEPMYREVLSVLKETLGEKHPDYAGSLNSLASVYQAQELFVKAEPLRKEAVAIRKEVLGAKHPEYADSLNSLAVLYYSQGLFAKAEPLFKEALAVRKEALGEKHPDYADSLDSLAGLYYGQNLFAKAEPLNKEAVAICKEVLSEKHPRYALSLHNLAVVYAAQGFPAKAEPLYREILALRKEVLGEKHPLYADSLNNLALLYQDQGLVAKAEPLMKEVLAVRKAALGERHSDYAGSLSSLAGLYYGQGLFAEAEPLIKDALAIRKAALGDKHPDYASSLNNLAVVYTARGLSAKAEPLYKEAIGISEAHQEQTASIQSESRQLTYAAASRTFLNNLLRLPNTDAADVYEVAFRWRGAVTARQTFARAARGTDPASLKTLDELRDVSRRLSNLVNNPPRPGPGVDVPKLLNDLDNEREALETALAARSKNFAKYQASRKLTPADIQKLLPAAAVLVDFLVYGNRVAAFVITSKSIVRVDLATNRDDIEELVADFRGEMSLNRTRPVQGKGDKSLLREAVWEPLVPHLKGASLVLVCPDGPLCRVPFAALRGADPKKYLIEEVAIAVIPVPRLLPELLAARPAGAPSLLVVGDVDFGGDPGAGKVPDEVTVARPTRAGGPLAWKPLDATAGEMRAVGDLFRKSAAGAVVTSLGKGGATEAAIRREAGRHRYLHFATHGFFDEPDPVAKADPKAAGLVGDPRRPAGPNPALRCGLVCAGANRPTPDDDGVLTALEIADLDLGGVELAVLSACETGLGEVAGGDGVLGLQRAFQLAGARATVTSLWQVPDQATGALMARFYENRLKTGTPALEALREAQLWVLNEGVKAGVLTEEPKNGHRTPPLFWAAFVLAGDWR